MYMKKNVLKHLLLVCCCFSFQAAFAQPANDGCSGATNIPVVAGSTVSAVGTVEAATQTTIPNTNCVTNQIANVANDVWFSFTAVTSSVTITVTPSPIVTPLLRLDPALEVFRGNCLISSSISCMDNGGGAGRPETISNLSVTIGNTYYIRVYHFTQNSIRPAIPTFTISVRSIGGSSSTSTPTITAETGAVGCINVSWTSVANTTDYELFKDDVSVGRVTGTNTTSCNLVQGSNHCYKVRACTATQCGAFSNIDCADAGQQTISNYIINASATTGGQIVSGIGTYQSQETVTLVASASNGYNFEGWYESGVLVHNALRYSFPATSNRTLEARFSRTPITFNIQQFDVAPWQRLNEEYRAYFKVATSDGSDYKLYCQLGNQSERLLGTYASGMSHEKVISFNDGTYNPGTVTYRVAVGVDSRTIPNKTTSIIERFWYENSFCINDNNSTNAKISLPLKYIQPDVTYTVTFERDNHVSNTVTGAFSDNLTTANNHVSTTGILTRQVRFVHPGRFSFTIVCKDAQNNIVYQESGNLFLTKIGKISGGGTSNRKVIVAVGGWTNTIEDDIDESVSNYNDGNSFSVANYFAREGYNVWYIAHPNNDYVENNGYALGKALEKIKDETNAQQIHIICHSKGGLDLRAMLANKGRIKDYETSRFSFNFDASDLNGTLNSITFLATPHKGAILAGLGTIVDWFVLNSRGMKELNEYVVAQKFKNFTVPNNIRFLNVTGFRFSSEDKIMGDRVVELKSSRNPYFKLRQGGTKIPIQNYVNLTLQNHLLNTNYSSLDLITDRIGHISIHKASFLKREVRFPIIRNYLYLPCTYRVIRNISDFINDANNIETCKSTTELYFNILGSRVSNATIALKDSLGFNNLGNTDEQGILHNWTPIYPNTGDTIQVSVAGFDTLTSAISNKMQNAYRIAMIKNGNPTGAILYPKVEAQNYTTFTTDTLMTFKVTGQQVRYYQVWNMEDSANTYRQFNIQDSFVTVAVAQGDNLFHLRLINATDTIHYFKQVLRLPADSLNDYTYTARFQFQPAQLGAMLYVENKFVKIIDRLDDSFRLLNVHNKVALCQLGFQDTTFWLAGQDTSLNIQLTPRYLYTAQDSNIINFATLGKVQYWNGMTVKNAVETGRLSLKRYPKSYSNLRLLEQSETFEYQSLNPAVSRLKTALILDVPIPPKRDSLYMLQINGSAYRKVFLPQFEYEEAVQKVVADSISINGKSQLILMKKQQPIKSTNTGFRVHQSESIGIALHDLFRDPDALPNDLTIVAVNDSNFDFRFTTDSLYLQHKSCNTGLLSFRLNATHDQLTRSDTFQITVTPLNLHSTVRDARCFESQTGSISGQLSSNQRPLYRIIWSNNNRTLQNDSLFAGNYRITITDRNNCRLEKTITVGQPNRVEVRLGEDERINLGESIRLTPNVNRPQIAHWRWTPAKGLSCSDCESPNAQPLSSTIYKLAVIDTAGCIGQDTLRITVAIPKKTYMANIFSPNGDNLNDILYVQAGPEVQQVLSYQVFARNGSLVFSRTNIAPNDPQMGWDGKFDGVELPNGIFVWQLEILFLNGEREIFGGDVMLHR